MGDEDNQFWQGSISIQDGLYTWQIDTFKENFVAWSDFNLAKDLVDFDAALTIRRVEGQSHQYCYGLLFRKSPEGFNAGSYILSVCESGYFKVLYYDAVNS